MPAKELKEYSDEELILDFQINDNKKAFELLVQRYKNPLTNYVFRFLGDYEACVDVVQETMIRVFKNKDSYKSIAKFSTWIYTIAGNLARTELQRRKKTVFSTGRNSEEEITLEIPDNRYRPDKILENSFKEKAIQEALLKISETYRKMVVLRDIQELSYEEISEISGLPVGTVKSRINRGRAQLQRLLKNIYKE